MSQLLIDKPAGITSFGVVARVRRKLSELEGKKVKVGHTGTLDPFATGLLILMTGKDTKRCGEFLKLDKEYIATLRLGWTSTTGDPEGEVVRRGCDGGGGDAGVVSDGGDDVSAVAEGGILRVLEQFKGKIKQRPPAFSAIKVNGQRAYDLARKGVAVELPEREVEIYELEMISYKYPELVLRVKCSSGTYIRSLAVDIGEALGCGAYLTALRRTEVGRYRVEEAVGLDEWLENMI